MLRIRRFYPRTIISTFLSMRITRSASRTAATVATPATAQIPSPKKRKLESEATPDVKTKRKRATKAASPSKIEANSSVVSEVNAGSAHVIAQDDDLPAILTFSFEDAKQHLFNVDHRFEDLFDKMTCKPFQHLETVHPFR